MPEEDIADRASLAPRCMLGGFDGAAPLRLGNPLDSPTVDACECFDSPADGTNLDTALSYI